MNVLGQGESSSRGILSVSKSVGNSRLSLVATLKDHSNAGGISSKLKTLFIAFKTPTFSLSVFGAKNSPVHLLVKGYQCLLPSRKSNSILPVFKLCLILNRSKSVRPGSPVTPRYLCNETILSRFSFCRKRKVDVASVASSTVNDVSSTLLVSGVL